MAASGSAGTPAGGAGAATAGSAGAGAGGEAAAPTAGTGGTAGEPATPPSCTTREALTIDRLPATVKLAAFSESTGDQCFVSDATECAFTVKSFGAYAESPLSGSIVVSDLVCDLAPKAGACTAEKSCGTSYDVDLTMAFDSIEADGNGYVVRDFVVPDTFGQKATPGTCSYSLGDAWLHALAQAIATEVSSVRFACE
jgi:hypothetical protein